MEHFMTTPSIAATGAAFVAAIEEASRNHGSDEQLQESVDAATKYVVLARRVKWDLERQLFFGAARVAEKQPEGKL